MFDGNTSHLNFRLDLRVIVALLLIIIAGMLAIWRPWEGTREERTIEVTGQATIKAVPDEFVFYPTYQFKNASRSSALSELTQKSEEITSELKKLGVEEKSIKTNSSGYGEVMPPEDEKDTSTYVLQLAITVDDSNLAQKIQDYLLTTAPTGSVSPQAQFSDQKQAQIESEARDKATKEARKKADQSAQNLGFRIGAVKAVNDGTGFDGIIYPTLGRSQADQAESSDQKLTIQPGENELTYTVAVTYFIK